MQCLLCFQKNWPKLKILHVSRSLCGILIFISPRLSEKIVVDVDLQMIRLVDTNIMATMLSLDRMERSDINRLISSPHFQENYVETQVMNHLENIKAIKIEATYIEENEKELIQVENELLRCKQIEVVEINIYCVKEYKNLIRGWENPQLKTLRIRYMCTTDFFPIRIP